LIGSVLPDEALTSLQGNAPAILVVPTWQRGKPTPLTEPAFIARAQEFGERHGVHVFLKAHPTFIGRDGGLQVSGNDSRVHLLDPGLDVYPWLFRFNALVTDYSSIMFDYLLTGKPVLTLDFGSVGHQLFEPDYSLVPSGEYRYVFDSEQFDDVWLKALVDDPLRTSREDYANRIFATDPQQACDDLISCVDRLVEQAVAADWRVWSPRGVA
jgi:CDP-glycerol glycerophosphotransferase (TagB/SpsB family)